MPVSRHTQPVHTLFFLAAICNTAVRNPVGKVNPDSQNSTGGWVVVAQVAICSTLCTRSRVHAPRGFKDGKACMQEEIETIGNLTEDLCNYIPHLRVGICCTILKHKQSSTVTGSHVFLRH